MTAVRFGFFRRAFRKPVCRHYAVECGCIFVHKGKKVLQHGLALLRKVGEFFPSVVPSRLVGRKVCDHCAECGAESPHICGD